MEYVLLFYDMELLSIYLSKEKPYLHQARLDYYFPVCSQGYQGRYKALHC